MSTISELIDELELLKEKYGDIEVFVNIPGSKEKIGWVNAKCITKDDSSELKVFTLVKGCRCGSCYEWQVHEKEKEEFIFIYGDY